MKRRNGENRNRDYTSKRRQRTELLIRKATVIILLFTAIFVIISGILLYAAPSGPGSGEATALGITKDMWVDIHVWMGFIATGCLSVHLYLNRRPLIKYLKDSIGGKA